MNKPVELLVFEFLAERVAASEVGAVLYELDIQDTIYQSMKADKPRGVRISDAVSDMLPDTGGGLKEFDADVHLVCFARVEGKDQKQRAAAVQAVFDIEQAVLQLIFDDQYLGDRVCDVLIKRGARSYDVFDGKPYAIALIPLVVNPSGYGG